MLECVNVPPKLVPALIVQVPKTVPLLLALGKLRTQPVIGLVMQKSPGLMPKVCMSHRRVPRSLNLNDMVCAAVEPESIITVNGASRLFLMVNGFPPFNAPAAWKDEVAAMVVACWTSEILISPRAKMPAVKPLATLTRSNTFVAPAVGAN